MSDICKLSTKIVKLENFGGGEGAVVYAEVVKRAAEVRGGNASDVQRACVYTGAGRNATWCQLVSLMVEAATPST